MLRHLLLDDQASIPGKDIAALITDQLDPIHPELSCPMGMAKHPILDWSPQLSRVADFGGKC